MSALKAIQDEKLAKHVAAKVAELDERLLIVGQAVQSAMKELEQVITVQVELKQALRTGAYQMTLPGLDR